MVLAPVTVTHAPVRIAPGEHWCLDCGTDVPADRHENDMQFACPVCGSPRLVPAASILRPEEFEVRH